MPQVLCPVLVGRDDEARRLRTALTAAGTGRGSTLLLVGEAGIGKSRLVRETARMAGERGLTVLAGRAVAGGIPVPYRPFAEALTSAGRAGRRPASEDLAPFRPVLGRLIPEWRPAQPPPGDQPAPGEESPVFLGEAVLRLLRALAPDTGCLLVLEDLHWADRETLALLEYLADNLAAERILCLGTLRAQSPGRSDAGAAALASALAARGAAAVLPLGRLGPAAVADMTRACLDAADLPDQVHGIVAERAEGIPFLVASLPGRDGLYGDEDDWLSRGNSVIVGPEGEILAGPLVGEEGMLYAEIDPARARASRQQFDPVGHYSRPDVFRLHVDTSPRPAVTGTRP